MFVLDDDPFWITYRKIVFFSGLVHVLFSDTPSSTQNIGYSIGCKLAIQSTCGIGTTSRLN